MKKKCKTCGQINEANDVICGMCGNDLSNPNNYDQIEEFQNPENSDDHSHVENQGGSAVSGYADTNTQNINHANSGAISNVRRRRNQFGIGKVNSGKRMWSLGVSKFIAFFLVIALPVSSYAAYYLTTGLTWKHLVLHMAEGTPVGNLVSQVIIQDEENSQEPNDSGEEVVEENNKNNKKKKKNNKKKKKNNKTKKKNNKTKKNKTKSNTYVLKNSNKKYIPKSTLKKMSTKKLAIARNEIYARAGRKFTTKKWKQYFKKKKWYKPKYSAKYFDKHSNKLLNKYEKKNIRQIKAIEKKRNKKK